MKTSHILIATLVTLIISGALYQFNQQLNYPGRHPYFLSMLTPASDPNGFTMGWPVNGSLLLI